jgi:hypothetical protein
MQNYLKQLVGVGHNETMEFNFNSNNNSAFVILQSVRSNP